MTEIEGIENQKPASRGIEVQRTPLVDGEELLNPSSPHPADGSMEGEIIDDGVFVDKKQDTGNMAGLPIQSKGH
jgi:hypothetical protein